MCIVWENPALDQENHLKLNITGVQHLNMNNKKLCKLINTFAIRCKYSKQLKILIQIVKQFLIVKINSSKFTKVRGKENHVKRTHFNIQVQHICCKDGKLKSGVTDKILCLSLQSQKVIVWLLNTNFDLIINLMSEDESRLETA